MIKPLLTSFLLILTLSLANSSATQAQNFTDAGEYVSFMSNQYRETMKDYLSYSSAVNHGKRARKIENRRKALLQSLTDGAKTIAAMPPFEGDKSLRDSSAALLRISYHIMNDDYGKIVDLEEISEQSYDAMEAYMLAQEKAAAKEKQVSERLQATEKIFAAKHKINLIEKEDDLSKKMIKTSKVNKYYNGVYLIFFKSYKQESYLTDALKNKNVNAIEQNRNTLIKYTEEGLAKLDTLPGIFGDRTLVNACKPLFQFYQSESKTKIPELTGFYLAEENFQKIKKAFEAKREKDRTQADVDMFNKGVNDLNKATNEFNNVNSQLFESRKKLLDNWNKSVADFLDKNTPKYK